MLALISDYGLDTDLYIHGRNMAGMFEPLENRTDGGFTNSYFEGELLANAAFPSGYGLCPYI